MKRLITTLPIGPYAIALFETSEPMEDGTASAIWNADEFSITLDASLTGARRWAILFHELVHAVSDLFELDIDREHVCSTIGAAFTQALRDYLPKPPRAQPPVPLPLGDDDDTPSVEVVPTPVAPPVSR